MPPPKVKSSQNFKHQSFGNSEIPGMNDATQVIGNLNRKNDFEDATQIIGTKFQKKPAKLEVQAFDINDPTQIIGPVRRGNIDDINDAAQIL